MLVSDTAHIAHCLLNVGAEEGLGQSGITENERKGKSAILKSYRAAQRSPHQRYLVLLF